MSTLKVDVVWLNYCQLNVESVYDYLGHGEDYMRSRGLTVINLDIAEMKDVSVSSVLESPLES